MSGLWHQSGVQVLTHPLSLQSSHQGKKPLPAEKESNVIYKVPCTCGKIYIGETKHRLEMRLKEHKDECAKSLTYRSAIAEYIQITQSTGQARARRVYNEQVGPWSW